MHPSRVSERSESYERLEFLGDSVLGLVVARALFDRYPQAAEGKLSQLRSAVVSRRSCAAVAREIGLDRMFAEQFELTDDLRRSDNVLAALIESAIAALVLEHGLDAVAPAVLAAFEGQIDEALHAPGDFKTRLQEEAAKQRLEGDLQRRRGRGACPRAAVHLRGARRRRAARHSARAARRRRPSRRPPPRRSRLSKTRHRLRPDGKAPCPCHVRAGAADEGGARVSRREGCARRRPRGLGLPRRRRSAIAPRRHARRRSGCGHGQPARVIRRRRCRWRDDLRIGHVFASAGGHRSRARRSRRCPRASSSSRSSTTAFSATERSRAASATAVSVGRPCTCARSPFAASSRSRSPSKCASSRAWPSSSGRTDRGSRTSPTRCSGRRAASRRASCAPRSRTTCSSPGSASASPLAYCEVELRFEDVAGALPGIDFEEVSIARRLHRGGEGQYLVNGATVQPGGRRRAARRRRARPGRGRRRRPGEGGGDPLVVSPAERRALVEEAAGLGRFKRRRHRAGAEARARRAAGRARARPRARGAEASAAARAPGERRRARGEARRGDRPHPRGPGRARSAKSSTARMAEARARRTQLEAAQGERRCTARAAARERERAEGELAAVAGGRKAPPALSTGCAALASAWRCGAKRRRICSSGCARPSSRSSGKTSPSRRDSPRRAPSRSSVRSTSARACRPPHARSRSGARRLR